MYEIDDMDSQDVLKMASLSPFGDHVDDAIFGQILEMDDNEDERDFSDPLVSNFFEQASDTFDKMQAALDASNLGELSSLGHFLKGSSATLGFNKIRDSCQVIQQYGHKLKVDGTAEPDEAVCLEKIADALRTVKVDTEALKEQMKEFFHWGNDNE